MNCNFSLIIVAVGLSYDSLPVGAANQGTQGASIDDRKKRGDEELGAQWEEFRRNKERRQRCLRRNDSELRYRRLFETAQDGILILDAKTGAIEDVNPYLVDMLGYSREEFLNKRLWEVGAFKDVEASKDAFQQLQEKKCIHYENLPLTAKDGRLVEVEFVSNVYQVGDQAVIQCNLRNISARKVAHRALTESDDKLRALFAGMTDPSSSMMLTAATWISDRPIR